MISSRKEIGEYSNESILTALRTPGGVADGGRVLIERGRGKKKAKYFTFGAAHGGPVMPEALIKEAPLTILTVYYICTCTTVYCTHYFGLVEAYTLHLYPTPYNRSRTTAASMSPSSTMCTARGARWTTSRPASRTSSAR